MSPEGKAAIRKVAARVHRDPTSGTVEDLRKLAAFALLIVDGKLPPRAA